MEASRFFLFLPAAICLALAGCAAGSGAPHPVSWLILGGLGLAVMGGAIAGLLGVRRLNSRLKHMELDLNERSAQIEQQRKELESLYRADDELRRHLRLDDVLQSLVNTAVELLHADKGSLLVWDDQREKLHARATVGFKPETVATMSFSLGQGLAGKVAQSGEAAIVEDAQLDERVTPSIIQAEKIRGLIQIPIRVAGQGYGIFSADYLQPHHFTEAEIRLLTAFAQRAGLAIETARLYEREEQIAVMQERNHLARDLHDSVSQSLYSVSLFAEVAAQQLKAGEIGKTGQNIQDLKAMALNALAEMRLLIYELRPSAFAEEGLVAAIQNRLDAVEARLGLQTSFLVSGEITLPLQVEEGFYRISQEALNNIIKHARARSVTISLAQDSEATRLEVVDDGVGFDPVQACEAGCLGLRGMQERAKEIGAEFEIVSRPGSGSQVIVRRTVR
jgi:signal transduction histidine kinase